MTLIQEKIDALKREQRELEIQYDAVLKELGTTTDFARQKLLWSRQDEWEKRNDAIQEEVKFLEQGQLQEHMVEDFELRLNKVWDDHQHEIDLRLPMDTLCPILNGIRMRQGGAALLLVTEERRMRAESLLVQAQTWIESVQNGVVRRYELTFGLENGLDEEAIVGGLLKEFGLAQEGRQEEQIARLVDTLYASHPDANTVVVLKIKLKLRPGSTPILQAFLAWFLQHLWVPLTTGLPDAAKRAPYLRLVVVLLTDLDEACLPATAWVAAPATAKDKGALVRILPWEQADLEDWLLTRSRLTEFGYGDDVIADVAADVHVVNQGVPHSTWRDLRDRLNVELDELKDRRINGKLASLQV